MLGNYEYAQMQLLIIICLFADFPTSRNEELYLDYELQGNFLGQKILFTQDSQLTAFYQSSGFTNNKPESDRCIFLITKWKEEFKTENL